MIEAAADAFEREGFTGAALGAILEASGAPRGSLYFHFPDGKEELALAAIEAASEQLIAQVEDALRGARSAAAGLVRVVILLADRLEASAFQKGCPIASVVVSSAAAPTSVRDAASRALATLESRLVGYLTLHGASARDAEKRATVVLAAIEGGLTLARIHRSREPLARVAKAIPLLVAEG